MANYMHFNFKTRDVQTGEVEFFGPAAGYQYKAAPRNCWGELAGSYIGQNKVLEELHWYVEMCPNEAGSRFRTIEEIRQAFNHFFPKDDKYTLDWEIQEQDFLCDDKREEKSNWPLVIMKNFGDYPRQLMISKLFVIRNMSRYANRTWRKMLEAGVDYGTAATVGACLSKLSSFRGDSYRFESYASVFSIQDHIPKDHRYGVTVADIRNFASCQRYLGEIGKPWGKGGGYLRSNEVMRSLIKPTYTNSPTLKSLGFDHYKQITPAEIESLLFLITGKKLSKSIL